MDVIPTIAVEAHGCALEIEIEIDVTNLCPVTNNPQPGSTCVVRYMPAAVALKPDYVRAYVRQFAGYEGRRVGSMEEVFTLLARACADAAGVPMHVHVDALLHDGTRQRMEVSAQCSTK